MIDQDTLSYILSYSFTPLKLVTDEVLDQVVVLVWSFLDQWKFLEVGVELVVHAMKTIDNRVLSMVVVFTDLVIFLHFNCN